MNNLMIIDGDDAKLIRKIKNIKENDELLLLPSMAAVTFFSSIPIGLIVSSAFGINKFFAILFSYFSNAIFFSFITLGLISLINNIKEKISLKIINEFNLNEKLLNFKNLLFENKIFTTEELGMLCKQYQLFIPFVEKAKDYDYNKETTIMLFYDCQNRLIKLLIDNKEIYSILLLGFTHPTKIEENAYFSDLYDFLYTENRNFEKMSGLNLLKVENETGDIKENNIDFLDGCQKFYNIKFNNALETDLISLTQYFFYKENYEEILQMQYNFEKFIKLKKERFIFDFNKDNIIENLFFRKDKNGTK